MGRRPRRGVGGAYRLWVFPPALKEMKSLPGYVRQRVKKAVDGLALDPHPPRSKTLDFPEFKGRLRRLRLDNWRVVYAVSESEKTVDVLAVRKRPPYQYEDLAELVGQLF